MRSDEELMQAFVDEGDERAFEALYRRHRPPVIALLRRRGVPLADAEDLAHEAFLRLYRARETYRRGEPLRPWLYTIAHRVRLDAGRAAARRPVTPADVDVHPSSADTHHPLERAESVKLLRGALAKLSPILRTTVTMHWIDERDFEDLSRELGVQQGTARVRAHRACARLRELLSELEPAA